MMKKLFVICAWTLLLGGCESDSGNAPGDVPPPSVDPVSPELKQKIEDLNAGLVTLRELTGAVSRSAVGAVTEGDAGTLIAFRDGTEVTVACDAEAAGAPLIGIAADEEVYYWTLAAEKDAPWLKDASGARMPVSGAVPVTDVDEEGYWTVAAGEAAPWRIVDAAGEPIEASEEVQAAQFRSVTMAEGRVKVVLTGGGELSAAKVDDLSAAGTANCYVVSTPGTYAFNAKVRGNGAGEAASAGFDPAIEIADGMKADWIWTDREGLVSDVVLDKESGEIVFTVGEGRGNALVALVQEDAIVWSWHIWVTDAPQTMAYENGVVFMDRNLGAVGTTVGGTDAYGMYYQWGRKDPFYWGTKTSTSATPFDEVKELTVVNPAYAALTWSLVKAAVTPEAAAANPMTFYNNTVGTGSNWLAKPSAKLWGEVKTLNDPCPPGYKVPDIDAWENLSSGRDYIDGVSAWDVENYGVTYTYNGRTAWYPGQGYRMYSTGAIVGQRASSGGSGGYWSSKATAVKAYYLYVKKRISTSGSINPELDVHRSYGYTVRCCKE